LNLRPLGPEPYSYPDGQQHQHAESNAGDAAENDFLLKAEHGSGHVPPTCRVIFDDVPCPSRFAGWIEELASEEITGGSSGGHYRPDNAVTRAQTAVFLLKAEHGSSYLPSICVGTFCDVTCSSLFANWIEQLAAEGITGDAEVGITARRIPTRAARWWSFW